MPSSSYDMLPSNHVRKGNRYKWIFVKIFTSLICLGFCLLARSKAEKFLMKTILNKIELKPNSEAYKNWLDPPIETKRTYFLFNYTNWKDVLRNPKSTPAKVQDSFGYVYNLKTRKFNQNWSSSDEQISYQVERLIKRHPQEFQQKFIAEEGAFVDMLRAFVRAKFEVKPSETFFSIAPREAFQQVKAVDLLEGFNPKVFSRVQERMKGPNTDKFGFVYRQNGSRLYNVTSKAGSERKGEIVEFASELVNFHIDNSFYPFPVYDGLAFPKSLSNKKKIFVFNSDFCRPFLIEHQETKSSFFSSETFVYKLKLVDTSTCNKSDDDIQCEEVDTLDVTTCFSSELPPGTIFLSKAHFYGSSLNVSSEFNIDGLNPNEKDHDSSIEFEPFTGTPIKAFYRIQLNIETLVDPLRFDSKSGEWIQTNNKAIKRSLPLFWIDQEVKVSDETIRKLRLGLFPMKHSLLIALVAFVILTIGSCLIISAVSRFCFHH